MENYDVEMFNILVWRIRLVPDIRKLRGYKVVDKFVGFVFSTNFSFKHLIKSPVLFIQPINLVSTEPFHKMNFLHPKKYN